MFNKSGKVFVDNNLVDPKNYVLSKGSTIVELKKDFLDSLDKKEQSLIENKKYNKYNICIKKLYYFAFLKIKKKYDCTSSIYDQYILKYILENIDCHIVSQFKEKMITDYVAEFLRRQYLYSESRDRIPKFSLYYKNYLNFFL